MRKFILFSLLPLLVAVQAFGHAGEVHKYMGTVAALHDDGSFTLKTTAGTDIHVVIAKSTKFVHADGRPASASDLAVGKRAVATISKDGETASEIKFAAVKKE